MGDQHGAAGNLTAIYAADARVRDAVEAELAWSPEIVDAAGIGVAVHDGVVALTGVVSSYPQRAAAARAALNIAGVTALANDIEVAPRVRRDDAAMAEQARDALLANVLIPPDAVRLQVSHGVIDLHGTVAWQYQRAAAYRTVERLPGVKGVIENIELKPRISSTDTARDIHAAFARMADLDASQVEVVVDGSTVRLRGQVSSYAEKKAAARAAWASPHVAHVVNDLRIAIR